MKWQEVENALVEAQFCGPPRAYADDEASVWIQGREDTIARLREALELPAPPQFRKLEGEAEETDDSAA